MKRVIIFLISFLFLTIFIGNTALAGNEETLQRDHQVTADELSDYIYSWRPSMPYSTRITIAQSLIKQSSKYGVDVLLSTAMVAAESQFHVRAASSRGARGLTQIMPQYHKVKGGDYFSIDGNLEAGIKHLGYLVGIFNRYDLAIAAYNVGEVRVRRVGGIPRTRGNETYLYTMRVMRIYNFLLEKYGREVQVN